MLRSSTKRILWYYAFLAVPLGIIGVFILLPVVWALYLSLVQYFPGAYIWVGLGNYRNMINNEVFWKALVNTFYYTLFNVPFSLAISMLLSVLVFRFGRRTQVFFKSALYLPSVASAVVLSLVWMWIYHPTYGLLNYVLSLFGIGPYYWLADPHLAMPSLIFMSLASGFGGGIILLTASMGSIPKDLYESAKLDGASAWREFWHITLPLLKPTILYLLIMGTIGSFQVFAQIYLMTEGGPAYATETMVHLIFRTAFDLFDFGQASAMATVLFVIIVIVSVLQYKYLSTDVQY